MKQFLLTIIIPTYNCKMEVGRLVSELKKQNRD